MGGAFQGSIEVVVQSVPERIWSVLENSTLLPQWSPMVKSTTGKKETTGSVRTCQVEWDGRKDEVMERCIEAIPNKKIAWVMEKGMMTKMFSTIRFWFELNSQDGSTLLRMGFLYEPKNFLARLMYHLMMKRKMEALRHELLGNLKRLA